MRVKFGSTTVKGGCQREMPWILPTVIFLNCSWNCFCLPTWVSTPHCDELFGWGLCVWNAPLPLTSPQLQLCPCHNLEGTTCWWGQSRLVEFISCHGGPFKEMGLWTLPESDDIIYSWPANHKRCICTHFLLWHFTKAGSSPYFTQRNFFLQLQAGRGPACQARDIPLKHICRIQKSQLGSLICLLLHITKNSSTESQTHLLT